MAERKIEIQMVAAGADQAAAEITKTTEATRDLTDAGEQQATAARQDIQISQQRAMVALQVAQGIGSMAGAIRAAAEDFKDADPELSGTLEKTAAGMESVGSMATYAAQGMAIAGPAGAAVGAAVGLAVPQIKAFYEAWVDLTRGLKEAEDSFQDVLDVEAEIAESRGIRAAIAAYREAATAADEFAQAVTRAKRADGANAEADKAERDLADAEAIRGGADPLEVKRARAQDDARRDRSALNKEGNMLASDRAQREIEVEKAGLTNDTARIQKAEEALAKAREAEEKYEDTASGRERTIDAQEKIKLRELDEKAAERERKADEKRAADERRHADETEAMEKRGNLSALDNSIGEAGGQLNSFAGQSAGRFAAAAGGARTGAARRAAPALARIGESLSDGTNEAEIQKLQHQFQAATAGMGGATVAALKQMLDSMTEQARKISTMQEQIKNLRKPGQ